MLFKFTAAGESLFRSNPSTFTIDKVVLGSSFGYTLANPPVDIQGSAVYTSIAVLPKTVIGANTIRFVKLLDTTVGDFNFGEVACYSGLTIVAVGVNPTAITKTSDDPGEGNSLGLNIFLSNSNEDAYGFLQVTNSNNNLAVSQINHVDYLNPPYDGEPNIYVVNGLSPTDTPTLSFADSYGRWNFSTKPETYYEGVVFDSSFTAIDIEDPHGVDFLSASQHFLQFISGALRGHVRQLTSIGTDFFGWNTPFTTAPAEGDAFIIVGPQASSGGGGGDFQAKIQFKDEGDNVGGNGTVTSVDFTGAGVTVTAGFYNDLTVNIPGGGGSTGVFQAFFDNNSSGSFDGEAFTNWSGSVESAASFCELSVYTNTIVFNTTGIYRITVEGRVLPSAGWPEGNKVFGTIISDQYTSHSRWSESFQNFPTSTGAGVNPAIARFSDVYVLGFAQNDTLTPKMYGTSYQNQSDVANFKCRVTIELLKAA